MCDTATCVRVMPREREFSRSHFAYTAASMNFVSRFPFLMARIRILLINLKLLYAFDKRYLVLIIRRPGKRFPLYWDVDRLLSFCSTHLIESLVVYYILPLLSVAQVQAVELAQRNQSSNNDLNNNVIFKAIEESFKLTTNKKNINCNRENV